MRKILGTGFFTVFLIGIAYFLLKFLIGDALAPLFRPLIMAIGGDRDYLVIPLTLVFTFILILLVGTAATRIRFGDLINKYFRRLPKNIDRARGALVALDDGAYFLAIVIKEVEFKLANGTSEPGYALYAPAAPFPWSGLPVIYARKRNVLLLKMSFGEIYSIVGSFGENSPASLAEFKS